MMRKILLLTTALFVTLFMSAQEIPQKISYQGKLMENNVPFTGTKNLTFTIGSWSEPHSNVLITEGLYSVTLGENNPIPISLFNNTSNLTLQVQVNGTYLNPDTDIEAVPYAFKTEEAVNTEKIAGNPVSGNPSTNEVLKWNGSQWVPQDDETLNGSNAGGDLSGTYPNPTVSKIQGQPVSSSSPTTDQVLKWNGSEWISQDDESGGLTLPYSGTYSGDNEVFEITSTGNNDLAIFEIDNSTNPDQVLTLNSNGTGEVFEIDNDGTGIALYISNAAGTDDAIYITNTDHYAIDINQYGSYQAINIDQYGTDDCVRFEIDNTSNDDDAIYAKTNGTGRAGYFVGDVHITGNLTGGKSAMMIDHPLYPEDKYLYHSSVGSPDMMNVYNGNIFLDETGAATIYLPEYFEALNMEFRYQLTCIGGFAPVYIEDGVSNNKFKIAGGTEGLEVSWQITGIRKDPCAAQRRITVEVEKSEKEKGYYLDYKAYNMPIEKSIEALKNPDEMESVNERGE